MEIVSSSHILPLWSPGNRGGRSPQGTAILQASPGSAFLNPSISQDSLWIFLDRLAQQGWEKHIL